MLFPWSNTDADIYKVVSVTVAAEAVAEVDEVRPEAVGALREEEEEAVVSRGSREARRSLL
jgi:hypothetical protein